MVQPGGYRPNQPPQVNTLTELRDWVTEELRILALQSSEDQDALNDTTLADRVTALETIVVDFETRITTLEEKWHEPTIFDFVPEGTVIDYDTDYTDALLAAEEAAWNNEIRTVYFPYRVDTTYNINGPQIVIRSGLVIKGDHSSQTQLIFTDLTGGLFWDGENFGGGGIERMGLVGDFGVGNVGNYMLRVGGGTTTNSPNQFVARDVLITTISGTVSYGIIADGTAFAGSAGGLRAPLFDDIKIFNSAVIAFDLRYVRSAMLANVDIFQGAGTNETINFSGLADTAGLTRTSVGVALSNVRCNDLVFDRCTDVTGMASVEVNVNCTTFSAAVHIFGRAATFTNAGAASNFCYNQSLGWNVNTSF